MVHVTQQWQKYEIDQPLNLLKTSNISDAPVNHYGTALLRPGPRLNIKTVLSTYGDFHVKDKTAVRTSYL